MQASASTNLVDYIILAEFDIDKGSMIRLQHPGPVQLENGKEADPATIAEYMLPEGGHKFGVVSTFFTLGRRQIKDLHQEQSNLLNSNQQHLMRKMMTKA